MNEKAYRKALIEVTAVGCATSAILVIITVYLYQNCSMISYIANGG